VLDAVAHGEQGVVVKASIHRFRLGVFAG